MKLPVVLRDEAQAEFDDAFDHYEGQRPGLGVTFAARVQEVFDRIASNPTLHAVVLADIRKAAVAKFPYRVYYRAEPRRRASRSSPFSIPPATQASGRDASKNSVGSRRF